MRRLVRTGNRIILSIFTFLLILCSSCTSPLLNLSVNGDNHPTFKVSGTASLYSFRLEEIDPQTQNRVGDGPLWVFEAKYKVTKVPMMWQLPEFKYGDVPSTEYEQRFPDTPEHPRQLEEGRWYRAEVFTTDKDICDVIFQIKSGKVTNTRTIFR